MDSDSYGKLTNAIIIQAVKDFRAAYRRYLRNPDKKEYQDEVAAQGRFFVSDWYASLTDVDGTALLKKVMALEKEKMEGKDG